MLHVYFKSWGKCENIALNDTAQTVLERFLQSNKHHQEPFLEYLTIDSCTSFSAKCLVSLNMQELQIFNKCHHTVFKS